MVDPFGNIVKAAKFFDEDLIICDIDLNVVRRARQQARHFLDEDLNFIKSEVKMLSDGLSKV